MFKRDKYLIIKKAISPEIAKFLSNYLSLKKQVLETYIKQRFIPPGALEFGTFSDGQVNESYSIYGATAFDVLLEKLVPLISKTIGVKIIPTYTYARSYQRGAVLHKHKDRSSCDISATLFLGGDEWPIYFSIKRKKIKIDLKPGDLTLYRGGDLLHWREAFPGNYCNQVFLHYNHAEKPDRLYDTRPHLGLPTSFAKKPENYT